MSFFESDREKLDKKMTEEDIYGIVSSEITRGSISPGLWAKALANSDGDERKAKARYIALRVDMVKTELAAMIERHKEEQRGMAEEQTGTEAMTPRISSLSTSNPAAVETVNRETIVGRRKLVIQAAIFTGFLTLFFAVILIYGQGDKGWFIWWLVFFSVITWNSAANAKYYSHELAGWTDDERRERPKDRALSWFEENF